MRITIVIFLLWAGLSFTGQAQGSRPIITRFAASPAKILPGQPSTLSWVVIGATSLTMGSGSGADAVAGTPVDGTVSLTVTPATTTSYTLTASNDNGSTTASATVMAGTPPSITFLTAIPAKVTTGQSSTLSWAVTGYPSLTVSPGVGVVAGTSVKVTPSTTQSYTLTATNSFGTSTAAVTVTAGRAPTITKFTASPVKVTAGQASTLSWAVTGSPSLVMSPSVGTLAGTSAKVTPAATQIYSLTATNSFGSVSAAVSVAVIPGSAPTIGSFTATPAKVSPGQASVLSWAATGATGLSVKPGVGAVSGTSVKVTPWATTSYTLTATNSFGSVTTTVPVMVGSLPTITGFTATPAKLTPGQLTTLRWAVTGTPSLILNPGFGPVAGTSVSLSPAVTTTYVLTATNSFGTSTASATATVVPLGPPLITAFFANPATVGPGISTTLLWATTGATSVSIDHGVGTVKGNSAIVSPTAATTYTLIASNGAGRTSATTTVAYMPLTTAGSLYYSEHAMFIVPPSGQVTWTGPNSWGSVYSTANVNSYVSTLKGVFPGDYAFVVVTANNLLPNNVPNVQPLRRTADGIGLGSTGVGVPSICNYNIGGGAVIEGAYGVLDHEIGHNWGVFLYPELSNAHGHWYENSTAAGQMAEVYSDDGYATVKQISFDPMNGFTWTAVDNITKNETETFSDHDLYLQGFNATFPDMYEVDTPVYNPDHTVSGNSFIKYDQAWLVAKYGARNPSYRTSPKRIRTGFIYIARDLAEVQLVYQPIERSINHFVNAEQIDTAKYRFQVPFLVDTRYRASLDALLVDLDGNKTPTLGIVGPSNLVSSDGTAVVPFTTFDADGPMPTVSCVPVSANCAIQGWNVVLTGMASGTHFFTIKAQDWGGKKVFAHFVVDVL